MSDSFELKLNSPLTKEDWNKICDAELEHTKKITYKTPSGKEVVFIPLAELESIKAEIGDYINRAYACRLEKINDIIDKRIKEIDNE